MIIGARTAAWAKSGYTAKDYVQDGLIAMWDGIENAGWGVHDPNATVWKDLCGSLTLPLVDYTWENSCLYAKYAALNLSSSTLTSRVLQAEAVWKWDSLGWFAKNRVVQIFTQGQARNLIVWVNGDNRYWEIKGNVDGSSKNKGFANNPPASTLITSASASFLDNTLRINGISCNHNNAKVSFGVDNQNQIILGNINDDTTIPKTRIYNVRFYSRTLTATELAANCAIDKARFNLPDVT